MTGKFGIPFKRPVPIIHTCIIYELLMWQTSVLIIRTSVTTLHDEDNFDNGRSCLQDCLTLEEVVPKRR
jgi:hypothetical protein